MSIRAHAVTKFEYAQTPVLGLSAEEDSEFVSFLDLERLNIDGVGMIELHVSHLDEIEKCATRKRTKEIVNELRSLLVDDAVKLYFV